ncbi:hypothetical protein E4U33_001584 [Claviceps sp. LM78 group G4]|nr:hypothetical protein E4U33_001584 [Claviceps sp. LM78 group G4]
MSSPSSSTSQPPSAQLGALRSPSRRTSAPPSQGDGSDNSITLSSHENAENGREAALGADSEPQRAPPLPRRRILDYVPRRRNNDELREVVEGEDCDFTDLWDSSIRYRDHLPPPEVMYDSFDVAVDGVTAWVKEHGVAYRKQKWTNKHHHRL